MTRRQARAILAQPAICQRIFRIHAECCSKGADPRHCETCAEWDSRARVESWQRAAARQAAAGAAA